MDKKELGQIYNSLSTYNRIHTYLQLTQRIPPIEIAEELDITRSALQHYIKDWKQLGLIETQGNRYHTTEKGEDIVKSSQYLLGKYEEKQEEKPNVKSSEKDFFSQLIEDALGGEEEKEMDRRLKEDQGWTEEMEEEYKEDIEEWKKRSESGSVSDQDIDEEIEAEEEEL